MLNTPSVGATKWWAGSLGQTANHAVVVAKLWVGGQDRGPHPFIMQIRDTQTLQPLRGITIGDIGPKLGYNGIDNGYMQFKVVHIPLDSLAARTGHVSSDGTYTAPSKANAKASYSSMTNIRVLLVTDSAMLLVRPREKRSRVSGPCSYRRLSWCSRPV